MKPEGNVWEFDIKLIPDVLALFYFILKSNPSGCPFMFVLAVIYFTCKIHFKPNGDRLMIKRKSPCWLGYEIRQQGDSGYHLFK